MLLILATAGGCLSGVRRSIATSYLESSKELTARDDSEAALAELAKAIRFDSTLAEAHEAVGDIYRKRGNYEQASEAYKEACDNDPYAFRPHYHLGLMYHRLGESAMVINKAKQLFQDAVKIYLRAITIEPDDFDANLNISVCYFKLGLPGLARQYCQAATQINPRSARAHSNLGIIYYSQNKLYEAVRAYRQSLELRMHQPRVWLSLGSTYMRLNRIKRALSAFKIAARQAPRDSTPWVMMGACHYHKRDFARAMAAYDKAIDLGPSNAKAYRGRGVVCMTLYVMDSKRFGMREKAIDSWHSSLELQPNQSDLRRLIEKYGQSFSARSRL